MRLPGSKFRLPTEYRRTCIRCEGDAFDVWYKGSGHQHVWGDDSGHLTSFISSGINSNSGMVDVAYQIVERAEAEAMLKVMEQQVDYGTALAELKKTVDYIAKRGKFLLFLINLLRRGRFDQLYRALRVRVKNKGTKTAGKAWLELQYAILPVIYDIYGTIELIKNGFRDKDLVFGVTRTITEPLDPYFFVGGTTQVRQWMSISGKASESARVTLYGKVDSFLHYLDSLGLINPLVVAWELVPFSFVIDWLIPIGNWLKTLTAGVGVEFVAGCLTRKREGNITAHLPQRCFGSPPDPKYVSTRFPSNKYRFVAIDRSVYVTWPTVLPYWRNPFSTTHVSSFLSLLASRKG